MSRLEWLQMKRSCASYGPPLTPYEQVELFRLEVELHETHGRGTAGADRASDRDSESLRSVA